MGKRNEKQATKRSKNVARFKEKINQLTSKQRITNFFEPNEDLRFDNSRIERPINNLGTRQPTNIRKYFNVCVPETDQPLPLAHNDENLSPIADQTIEPNFNAENRSSSEQTAPLLQIEVPIESEEVKFLKREIEKENRNFHAKYKTLKAAREYSKRKLSAINKEHTFWLEEFFKADTQKNAKQNIIEVIWTSYIYILVTSISIINSCY